MTEYKPVGFPVSYLHSLFPWVLLVVVLAAAEMFNFQINLQFSVAKDAFCKRLITSYSKMCHAKYYTGCFHGSVLVGHNLSQSERD